MLRCRNYIHTYGIVTRSQFNTSAWIHILTCSDAADGAGISNGFLSVGADFLPMIGDDCSPMFLMKDLIWFVFGGAWDPLLLSGRVVSLKSEGCC